MSKEHLYYEEYPEIYEKFPEKRQSRARGVNTLSENFKILRAFLKILMDILGLVNCVANDIILLNFLYKSPIPHIPKYARVREEIRNSVKHRTGVGASVVNKI